MGCRLSIKVDSGLADGVVGMTTEPGFSRAAWVASVAVGALVAASVASGAFPGRPGAIAFVRDDTQGRAQIWTIDPASGRATQLTRFRTGVDPTAPQWAAFGRQLVFGTNHGIRRLDLASNKETRLTETGGYPSWSPDGRRIIFAKPAYNRCTDLYALTMASRKLERLTVTYACESQPRWSPDGKTLAFVSSSEDSSLIVLRALRGSDRRHVISPEGADSPSWAPDGHAVAYVVSGRGIEIYDRQTRIATPIPVPTRPGIDGQIDSVDWSPDGQQLVYARVEAAETASGKPESHLFSVELDGTAARRITSDHSDSSPAWQATH